MDDRRLIEDYLPLDALNAISAKGEAAPSTVRGIGPSTGRPAAHAERQEAASFVTRLAACEPAPGVAGEACEHVRKAHGGQTPKVLDLFAGGGAIPLEAARLGYESHALDAPYRTPRIE